MRISATFLDEISHDIPHQNWGPKEWELDFQAMKAMGIDTVVIIRSGYKRWMTYPSKVLAKKQGGHMPSIDLIDLFLRLSEKYGMDFYFGLYDSGYYWQNQKWQEEVDINCAVVDEVWERYGKSPAFKGWYITQEASRGTGKIIDIYAKMGIHCKAVSNNLPVLISPFIEGNKTSAWSSDIYTDKPSISPEKHEKEWNIFLDGVKDAVDIVAFQDGHVDFFELSEYLEVNKKLTDRYGMQCWTNCEVFDREMPIKFFPLKWEKVLMKLEAAGAAGIQKGLCFEFSHFMSPNSCYPQAHGLYQRYCEHFGIEI